MKRVISILVAVLMVLALAGCASGATTQPTQAATSAPASAAPSAAASAAPAKVTEVKVGVILPFTGSVARMGELQFAGYQLYFDELNANGGIKSMGGAKIKLIKADTMGKAEVGVTEIERLITQEKVDLVIGPYNSAVGAATAPIAEKYKVPYLLTNCTDDAILTHGYKYVFRANGANSNNAIDIVTFIKDMKDKTGQGPKTFGIVYENTDWGKGMATQLKKFIPEIYGGQIVLDETYEANAADLSPLVNKIKAANPDMIIPMSYLNDALLLVNGMAQYKVDSAIFASGGGFSTPDFVQKSGKAGEKVLTVTGWSSGILQFKPEAASKLNEKYKAKYNIDIDEYAANGYLGAAMVGNVLERAASIDKEKIRETFASTDLPASAPELILHPYKGIKFGEIRGMTNQNVFASMVILQVVNGKFELVGPTSMVTKDSKVVWPVPKFADR